MDPRVALAEPNWDQPVRNLDVADFRGRVWKMSDFRDADIMVVAFLGTECPLAKLYASRLTDLQDKFADQRVAIVGVMSNRQDSIAEISAFARRYQIEFPLLKDAGNRLADAMGAERTPEVFLLDRERNVRYWGRIDDQYGIGYAREEPQKHELREAIENLLAGQAVANPQTRSVGCIIGRQKSVDESATVSFTGEVARILNRRCVECHREGEIAPFALADYEEAAGWADMIAEVVRDGRMPPWHADPKYGSFSNDRSMTPEEKQTLYDWANAGAPQGDPADLPEPPTFVTGWQLPREPDLVLNVSPEPFQVPADGAVAYKYFKVDPGLDEDTWLEAAEFIPGNRAVVHHILGFYRPKGSNKPMAAERSFLVGYVPGARVEQNPPGMAKRLPANSELVFQVHYTPIGTPQLDQSKLGMVFADPAKITHEVVTSSAVQTNLRIQPGDPSYQVSAIIPELLPKSLLLGMSPHMHLRGKAFRYEIVKPDSQRETILDVPAYDFNWQTTYQFAEPLELAAGSRIACTAVFDNSEDNLNNPNPQALVRWGDQTDDEMMIGYFHYAVKLDDQGNPLGRPAGGVAEDERMSQLLRLFSFLDSDADDRIDLSQVPERIRRRVSALDSNQDGILTLDEVRQGGR
ncbi:redoxin domain-containing protein [Planctomycetaceae bacterium SH139]